MLTERTVRKHLRTAKELRSRLLSLRPDQFCANQNDEDYFKDEDRLTLVAVDAQIDILEYILRIWTHRTPVEMFVRYLPLETEYLIGTCERRHRTRSAL